MVKYYLDMLGMTCAADLFVNQVNARGDISQHPCPMKETFLLGEQLASSGDSVAKIPLERWVAR